MPAEALSPAAEYLSAGGRGPSCSGFLFLEVPLSKLDDIFEKVNKNKILTWSMYSNLAQGYFLLDDYTLSKEYFMKALENAENDRNKLIIMIEAFDLFKALNELDFIVDNLYELDTSNLQLDDMNVLYRMIIKIMHLMNESDVNINSKKRNEIFVRI